MNSSVARVNLDKAEHIASLLSLGQVNPEVLEVACNMLLGLASDVRRLERIEELAMAAINADTHYANNASGPNMEILERCVAALRDEVGS